MLNAYLFAIREHASEKDRDRIDEALTPPRGYRKADGTPAWWDEDEAWQDFRAQLGPTGVK
jgi:hypothetical protein